MGNEEIEDKRAVAHFEVGDETGESVLAPTTTGGTGTEKGYAGSIIGDTHRSETKKAERKLLLKLGEGGSVGIASSGS